MCGEGRGIADGQGCPITGFASILVGNDASVRSTIINVRFADGVGGAGGTADVCPILLPLIGEGGGAGSGGTTNDGYTWGGAGSGGTTNDGYTWGGAGSGGTTNDGYTWGGAGSGGTTNDGYTWGGAGSGGTTNDGYTWGGAGSGGTTNDFLPDVLGLRDLGVNDWVIPDPRREDR